jgi:hypothetical protein
MGTKASIFQPGHDGKMPARPNAPAHHTPARGADAFKGHAVAGNIARNGAPKVHADVPVHGGMTRRQVELKGMGHAIGSAPDASAANPLDKTVPGKTFAPVQAYPGMRSRSHDTAHGGQPGENHTRNVGRGADSSARDLGARILDEAFAASAPDDRMAHGRK